MDAFLGEVYLPAQVEVCDDEGFVLLLFVKDGWIIFYWL